MKKFNPNHFKFTIEPRRFMKKIWEKYNDLKKIEKLSDMDKYWLKQVRAALKVPEFMVTVKHVPTGLSMQSAAKGPKVNRKECIDKLIAKIQTERKAAKVPTKKARKFDGAEYFVVGGVFDKFSQINEIAKKTKTNDPYARKTPRRKDTNYIGVELEFNETPGVDRDKIAAALKSAGLGKYVDVTTDPSCGWEVRVLLPEAHFETYLKNIMDILKNMGHKADNKCGTHVHLDMRSRDVNQVYRNFFKTQKFLRKFLTKSRKNNRYCRVNKHDDFEDQRELGEDERYYGINVQAYERHNTLEIRMHQGTLQADELIPWIKCLIKIANHKVSVPKEVNTLKQARQQYQIEDTLAKTLEDRIYTVFGRVLNLGAM